MGRQRIPGQVVVNTVDGPKVFTRESIEAAWPPPREGFTFSDPRWKLDDNGVLRVWVSYHHPGREHAPRVREVTVVAFAPGYWTHMVYGPESIALEDYLAE